VNRTATFVVGSTSGFAILLFPLQACTPERYDFLFHPDEVFLVTKFIANLRSRCTSELMPLLSEKT
jgi:hypothetical protein